VGPDHYDYIIKRGEALNAKMGHIFLKNKKIIGATLLNLPADRAPLLGLISSEVVVSDLLLEKLKDPQVSLEEIKNG
jgi:hypothetical protein